MGYSVAFLGDLTFTGGGYEQWLAASIDAALFTDWPHGWKPEDAWSVDQVLTDIDGMIVSLERDEKHVKLRLLVSNDDGFYLESRQNLLAAFRQAGAWGGAGGLTVIGWGDSDRFAVRAGADGTCVELEAEARDAVEESAPYRELEALAEASRATEKERIAAFISKRDAEAHVRPMCCADL
jgi:hypothetical protein